MAQEGGEGTESGPWLHFYFLAVVGSRADIETQILSKVLSELKCFKVTGILTFWWLSENTAESQNWCSSCILCMRRWSGAGIRNEGWLCFTWWWDPLVWGNRSARSPLGRERETRSRKELNSPASVVMAMPYPWELEETRPDPPCLPSGGGGGGERWAVLKVTLSHSQLVHTLCCAALSHVNSWRNQHGVRWVAEWKSGLFKKKLKKNSYQLYYSSRSNHIPTRG